MRIGDHTTLLIKTTCYDHNASFSCLQVVFSAVKKKLKQIFFFAFAEDKCGDFPGPGNTSPATYNVFHEVIGTEGKPNTQHVDRHFEDFKQKYGRKYLNDKEHAFRRKNFHHNLRYIYTYTSRE